MSPEFAAVITEMRDDVKVHRENAARQRKDGNWPAAETSDALARQAQGWADRLSALSQGSHPAAFNPDHLVKPQK